MSKSRGLKEKASQKANKSASANLLDELFNDMYKYRLKIYRLNFIRGILFGAGSIIGGTLVIAMILWILSLFDQFPFIESIRQSVESSRDK